LGSFLKKLSVFLLKINSFLCGKTPILFEMTLRYFSSSLLIFILFCITVSGQNAGVPNPRYVLTGKVLHYPEKTPFSGVTIATRGATRTTTTTKEDGTFRLEFSLANTLFWRDY